MWRGDGPAGAMEESTSCLDSPGDQLNTILVNIGDSLRINELSQLEESRVAFRDNVCVHKGFPHSPPSPEVLHITKYGKHQEIIYACGMEVISTMFII